MKGISTVIATILMLMITIALAGTAYLYISGTFTQQTAAVIDVLDTVCSGSTITTTVANQGTAALTATATATQPNGNGFTGNTCSTSSLTPGNSGSCTITRPAGTISGTYSIAVTASGARTVRGNVFCSTGT